ncbi:hypothetical protein NDU88_010352 [Pleurodeles waltl]|uniref:Uncharacterized protein n=1 Tax=Pleurodeles waltl TaxID=8319 RepID=A0AAV7RZ23_PLEWA|nr:hypothetical protein NDU88_010352 [Pleurodeles waltl]
MAAPLISEVRFGGLARCLDCGLSATAYWGGTRTPQRVAAAVVTAAGTGGGTYNGESWRCRRGAIHLCFCGGKLAPSGGCR